METVVGGSDAEEPTPERTETEKIAQYRIDYPATLKSVADVLVAKVNAQA